MWCFLDFGCQYQCSRLPENIHLQNDVLCVECDVKPYTLILWNRTLLEITLPLIFLQFITTHDASVYCESSELMIVCMLSM